MEDEIDYNCNEENEYFSGTQNTNQNNDLNYQGSSDLYYDTNDNIELSNPLSYNIVHLNELSSVRNKLIADFIDQTCVDRDEAIIALIEYKWNLDKINDDWYNDVDGNRKKFGIDQDENSLKQLKNEKVTTNSNYCLICYSPVDFKNKSDCYALKCGHVFCNDCWKDFIATKLDDYFCCLYSTCPQKGCNLRIPESLFNEYLKDSKANTERFEKIVLKNFTENNNNVKWCPKDCGRCSRTDAHANQEIICGCKNVYCFNCLREGHRPCFCEIVENWERKNTSEGENVKWLTVNTKKCPACHKHIEKNQGCNHMTCRKEAGGCGHEFCWICFADWKSHNNNYNCNKFDEKAEKSKEKIKNELDKYIFNFSRYINHRKSRDICISNRELIKNRISQLFDLHNLPFIENQFLEEGLNIVEKGRRVLMYTYVFGYYLDSKSKHKLLFEHNQQLLERNCDYLHELIEDETLKKIMEEQDFDEFNKKYTEYKAIITNYSSVTNKYIDNLINDIETKMIGDVIFKQNDV